MSPDDAGTLAPPPLVDLAAARAVARHGSLGAAAAGLGVTAGALSRRVAALEAWLGMPLFERHGRGMRATPDGQRFLSRVDEAFALIEAAAVPWRGRRGSDVVRLSVLPFFARAWLVERLAGLEGTGGGRLRIELVAEYRTVDVAAGEADIAVRYGRGAWPGLDARPFLAERLVPVACPAIAEALAGDAGPSAPSALLAHPLLCDSDALGWRAWFAGTPAAGFRPRAQDRRFEDYGLVLAAAGAGLGVALARLPLAERAVAEAGLRRVGGREVASPLAHHLVMRAREARPAVLALAERLLAARDPA